MRAEGRAWRSRQNCWNISDGVQEGQRLPDLAEFQEAEPVEIAQQRRE
jgi:hypothetical protein